MPMKPIPIEKRFWAKVQKSDDPEGCWLWTGATNKGRNTRGGPYGKLGDEYPSRKTVLAHRVAWRLTNGEDPPAGMQVDHACNNSLCVNPDHLRLLAPRDNNARSSSPTATNASKTHCPQGHEYTPANTGFRKGAGFRYCRECARLAMRAQRAGMTYPEWRAQFHGSE